MQKIEANDPETRSADLVAGNLDTLKSLFPEAFSEGKVDFEVLKQLLGGAVEEREEKYGLNWHGKRRARQLALTPSTGTLRPCPEDSVDWDSTQNLMIEGDNLEVLKLLQKSYAGKVKLIYIDPPYNTGKDFVYPDNFQDNIKNYLELTGQVEGGRKISSNTEASGRFHTDWLNMMYPRLKLARNLLREDGLLFMSIDDSEVANVCKALDEIFGEDHRLAQLIWKNKYNAGALTKGFSSVHEYVLCYSKGEVNNLTTPLGEVEIAGYKGRDSKFESRGGFVTQPLATSSKDPRPNLRYPILIEGREIWPDKQWIWSKERVEQAIANDEVVVNESSGKISVRVKQYLRGEDGEMREMKPLSIMIGPYNQEGTKEIATLFGNENVFSFPKPMELVRHWVSLTINDNKDKEVIVLDFFAGSGTTGHAVMAQNAADGGNRRYILVQLPESLDPDNKDQKTAADFCDQLGKPRTIAELTKERLRRAAAKIKSELTTKDTKGTKEENTLGLFRDFRDFRGEKIEGELTTKDTKGTKEENPPGLFRGFRDFRGEKKELDLGFRVFKLDSSNIRAWEPDRDNLAQSLFDASEHLKADRSENDVLFELLLKLGLDLTVPINTRAIAGKTVHSIGAGVLLVCLADKIANADVEALALGLAAWHQELAPAGEAQVVFRDSAFADDVAKTNCTAILSQHGLSNVRSL